jgi:hypothetical protein
MRSSSGVRYWLLPAVALALLAPGAASAQMLSAEDAEDPAFAKVNAHPAECSRLRRQIDHFSNMHARAAALDNDLWQARTKEHVQLLRGMQAARCPGDVPVDTTAEAFKQLLKLAAKGAVTYFTMGAYGF